MSAVKKLNPFITRRKVQIVLGCLWLLDGVLQLQRQMFTSAFVSRVISPAASGQPLFVRGPMHFAIHMFLMHPAVFNSFIAIIQLGLGILILWKRTARLGLMLSVLWGLFVWFIGEGLGGLASFQTLILIGAPGAAIIYSILALAVMPNNAPREDEKKKDTSPAYWLGIVWAVLWVVGGIYQLLPGQNTISDMSSMILGMANGAPGWMSSLDTHVARIVNGFGTTTTSMAGLHMTASQMAQMQTESSSGYWFILFLAIIQILIGLAIFLPKRVRNTSIWLGIIVSLFFWVVGQSMGGYFTGVATDPSTGPLFILLGVAIMGSSELKLKKLRHRTYKRLEKALT